MKIIFALFLLLSFACTSATEQNPKSPPSIEEVLNNASTVPSTNSTAEEVIEPKTPLPVKPPSVDLKIDKESDYSARFIDAIKAQKQFKTIHLAGDSMILENKQSIPFPNVPALGETIQLYGNNAAYDIALKLKRVNYSSIHYRMSIEKPADFKCAHKGSADLNPFFFLGSETDTNELTGEAYFSLEYSDQKDDCTVNIRIGTTDEGKAYLAKVIIYCEGSCSSITLEESPVFVAKEIDDKK